MGCRLAAVAMFLAWSSPYTARGQSGPSPSVTVPFVGCRSIGQTTALEAPTGAPRALAAGAQDAQSLAYYQSADPIGVVGPRGWHCTARSGSGGEVLRLSPQPTGVWGNRLEGPVIEINHFFGDTSGRYSVAKIIARVFPAFRKVLTETDFPLPSGPFPHDTLIRKGRTIVEYTTPSGMEGLGTFTWLAKGGLPVTGAVMLIGETPDAVLLAIRLPRGMAHLAPVIIREAERDQADHLSH